MLNAMLLSQPRQKQMNMKIINYPDHLQKLSILFTALVLVILTGCTSTSAIGGSKTKEYTHSHALIGQASWYGNRFHGKLTASGETYNMNAYTSAHKSLPFGTIVRVTNTANNKSVDVKINDRGPYVKGRVIDLSYQAFTQIGNIKKGTVPVKIEIIDDSNTFRYKH